jgi:hypothetical protein
MFIFSGARCRRLGDPNDPLDGLHAVRLVFLGPHVLRA